MKNETDSKLIAAISFALQTGDYKMLQRAPSPHPIMTHTERAMRLAYELISRND